MSTVQCNLVQPTMLSFGSRVGLTVVSLLARHTGLSQTLSEAGPTTVHMRISTLWKIQGFLTEFSDGKYCGDSYPRGVWVFVMPVGKKGFIAFCQFVSVRLSGVNGFGVFIVCVLFIVCSVAATVTETCMSVGWLCGALFLGVC